MITLYTRINCPACVQMKKALSENSIKFTERVINSDISTDEVLALFPGVTHLPILAIKRLRLGGIDELKALIRDGFIEHLENLDPTDKENRGHSLE